MTSKTTSLITSMVKTTFGEATSTKMVGQPTSGSIKILTTELAKVTSTFSNTQWWGTYKCRTLILTQDEMRYMTHDNNFHSGPIDKTDLVNANITDKTTGHELVLIQELQRKLWQEFDLQVAVDRAGVDTIAAVVNDQYI